MRLCTNPSLEKVSVLFWPGWAPRGQGGLRGLLFVSFCRKRSQGSRLSAGEARPVHKSELTKCVDFFRALVSIWDDFCDLFGVLWDALGVSGGPFCTPWGHLEITLAALGDHVLTIWCPCAIFW